MIVYPAIDLRGGRVVRLRQGDYAAQTLYDTEPLALARSYAQAGARWLHVVDLDAAASGEFTQLALLQQLTRISGLSVQAGGGVRGEADLLRLLGIGVSRVVVGSVSVLQPDSVREWLSRHGGERLCVALDARARADGSWSLPVRGWTEDGGADLFETLARLAAGGQLRHVLCTDIGRDGMLSGPNLALYRELVARHPGVAFQASGGVASLADLRGARDSGVAGVVVGKALLEGRFSAAEALAC